VTITTSDFSSGTRKEAARPDVQTVALINSERLVLFLVEHNIGVSHRTHDLGAETSDKQASSESELS